MLAPIDIADQPDSQYILLTEGTIGTQAFAVDKIEIQDGAVRGYLYPHYLLPVVVVPVLSPWGLISRGACVLRTLEESMLKQKADREQEAVLIKEIFGIDRDLAPTAKDALPTVPAAAGHYM